MVKYIIVSLNVSARRKKRTENLKDKYAAKLEKLRKRHELKREFYRLLKEHASDILSSSNFRSTRNYIQHGSIPVYNHCMDVAGKSIALSRFLGAGCNERDLIRGALLHDYFLYDWHIAGDNSHHFHGFTHPKRAFLNALHDVDLNFVECNIILRHMFPLTFVPPMRREAWLVCLADKICATKETLHFTHTDAAVKYGSVRES